MLYYISIWRPFNYFLTIYARHYNSCFICLFLHLFSHTNNYIWTSITVFVCENRKYVNFFLFTCLGYKRWNCQSIKKSNQLLVTPNIQCLINEMFNEITWVYVYIVWRIWTHTYAFERKCLPFLLRWIDHECLLACR